MRTKKLSQLFSLIVILVIGLMLAGCTQPQKKPDQSPTTPQPDTNITGQPNVMDQAAPSPTIPQAQNNMMGQADPSSMMHNHPEAMQKAMSAPENRQAMIKMMKDPAMRQSMTDIMADPAMRDNFSDMVKDPRLAPIAREALKK